MAYEPTKGRGSDRKSGNARHFVAEGDFKQIVVNLWLDTIACQMRIAGLIARLALGLTINSAAGDPGVTCGS